MARRAPTFTKRRCSAKILSQANLCAAFISQARAPNQWTKTTFPLDLVKAIDGHNELLIGTIYFPASYLNERATYFDVLLAKCAIAENNFSSHLAENLKSINRIRQTIVSSSDYLARHQLGLLPIDADIDVETFEKAITYSGKSDPIENEIRANMLSIEEAIRMATAIH